MPQRHWTLRKLKQKYLMSFEMGCKRKMQKIKWSDKVTNKEFFEHIGEKRTFLNNILRRKPIGLVTIGLVIS